MATLSLDTTQTSNVTKRKLDEHVIETEFVTYSSVCHSPVENIARHMETHY